MNRQSIVRSFKKQVDQGESQHYVCLKDELVKKNYNQQNN